MILQKVILGMGSVMGSDVHLSTPTISIPTISISLCKHYGYPEYFCFITQPQRH